MVRKGIRKNGVKLLLINGLQVRVLPGSPLFLNGLASPDFFETKNCAQFWAAPGSRSLPLDPCSPTPARSWLVVRRRRYGEKREKRISFYVGRVVVCRGKQLPRSPPSRRFPQPSQTTFRGSPPVHSRHEETQ